VGYFGWFVQWRIQTGTRSHLCRANTQRRQNRSSQKKWSHPLQRAEAAAALRHAVREFLCCRAALLSWSKALRQSRCVTRAQQSAGCFTSIRGMLIPLTLSKIIETQWRTFSGNGDAAQLLLACAALWTNLGFVCSVE